jgi:hypothetical protein
MKIPFKALLVTSFAAITLCVSAEDKTLTGKAECAKCSLGKTDKCQMALTVNENGKDTTYLVENNDVSKKFHKNICSESKEVTVKGSVKDSDGKKTIEAKEINVATK